MRRMARATVLAVALGVCGALAQARAEGFFIPWAGISFGDRPVDDGRGSFGFTAGSMGAGVLGAELDVGYAPSFFGPRAVHGRNYLLTGMGNVIVGIPFGGTRGIGLRPYVTGGVGLIRSSLDDVFGVRQTNNGFGVNAGVGVMGFFSDRVGLRGDLRYFRNVNRGGGDPFDFDLGGFDFWRASIGLVLR
jgi:hypothetical protein